MLIQSFLRRFAAVIGMSLGAAGVIAVTTPASATCWMCAYNGVWFCNPMAPGAGGYSSCTAYISYCVQTDICRPMLTTDVDIDGRVVTDMETVVTTILKSAVQENTAGTFAEYLDSLTGASLVRNCKGIAIAKVGAESRPAPIAPELVL